MPLKKMEVSGFRGFIDKQEVVFSIPNGDEGSGLTIITGANNSGKSSIVECLKSRSGYQSPSFSAGVRNASVDFIDITYHFDDNVEGVRSLRKGGSETERYGFDESYNVFVLPSRRAFEPYFYRNDMDRNSYINNSPFSIQRSSMMKNFESRLFKINESQDEFNPVLFKVLGFEPEWSIDLSDQGGHFLKFYNGEGAHSSDGLGEGIVSVFAIVDSLYDSNPNDVIVIDEPELSLHPALQKRVFSLVKEYSKDRQIIISTHSPYFVDVDSIVKGACLVRVVNNGGGTRVHQLSRESVDGMRKLAEGNLYNPHIFGVNAKELFFLEDNVIVVEGQEDVLLMPKIAEQLGLPIDANFFGWGAGGASNISHVCRILKDLGFRKVAGILDGDKKGEVPRLNSLYPEYYFDCICADDIRTKKSRKATGEIKGLLDSSFILREENRSETEKLLKNLNSFMSSS